VIFQIIGGNSAAYKRPQETWRVKRNQETWRVKRNQETRPVLRRIVTISGACGVTIHVTHSGLRSALHAVHASRLAGIRLDPLEQPRHHAFEQSQVLGPGDDVNALDEFAFAFHQTPCRRQSIYRERPACPLDR
jgi:hypothetical protein